MRFSSIAAVAGLALSVSAAPASAADVLYVGDSLGVGTMPRLAQSLQGDRVGGDNRVGRPSPEALSVLTRLYSPSADVVVFDAGTNDDPSQPARLSANLGRARDLSGSSCLVVATLNRPPLNGVSIAGMNRALRAFATQTPGVQLVEWNEAVALQPDLLGPDRVHPTPQGYGVRAQMFAEAISSCGRADLASPRAKPDDPDAPARAKRKRRRPRREVPVPGIESSGISFTEPVTIRSHGTTLHGDVLLPSVKPPYRGVVLVPSPGGPGRSAYREQAEYSASHGLAALVYDPGTAAADAAAAHARAVVAAMAGRKDVRGRVALWARAGGGLVAPAAAAGNAAVAAVVVESAPAIDAASARDWRVRRALGGGGHAVTTWFRLKAHVDDDPDPASWWRRVGQPVLATWDTRSQTVPNRASAAALRGALGAGPNRDRTFQWAPGGATMDDVTRWLRPRLAGTVSPVVRTPLPPANGTTQPMQIRNASALTSPPVQLAWLLLPGLALALLAVRQGRAVTFAAAADLAALGAIAGGVAVVVSADGQSVAKLAGLPLLFALAWLLLAVGVVLALRLARGGATGAAVASAAWLGLALFWLL